MSKLLLSSALALAGAVLATPAAHALGIYNDGDLFLGFRSTDSSITNDFFIDLGQPDQFETAAPGATIVLGNFGADLSAVFGSYYSSTTLFAITGAVNFSTTSGNDPGSTLYTTVPFGAGLFPAKPDSVQGSTATTITGLGARYSSAPRSGASTANGVIESVSAQNSYRSFQPGGANSGGISFGYFNPTNENAVNAGAVKIEEIIATDDGANAQGKRGAVQLGTVTVSSAGVVTFQAVPEPGSLPLLACGAAALAGFVRRRRALA